VLRVAIEGPGGIPPGLHYAAEVGEPKSTKTTDLTLAWRGQGYCLVELGRFDEAEKLYKKCLALDPSDKKAKGELEYIKSKRR